MVVLAKRPGMTQHELAELSHVDRTSMVALLDELEARGLAERRPHPGDRRKRCIYLTPEGTAMLERLQAEARRSGEAIFARLSADERAELHRLLRKMAALD
jgi:DNA-binding MarR family transcriptional regulator